MLNKAVRFCIVIFIIAFTLMLLSIIDSKIIGGDAFNGQIDKGKFFLYASEKMIETDAVNWYLNFVLIIATFVFLFIGMFCFVYVQIKVGLPKIKEMAKHYFESLHDKRH